MSNSVPHCSHGLVGKDLVNAFLLTQLFFLKSSGTALPSVNAIL